MRKNILAFLVTMVLLNACGSRGLTPTPTAFEGPPKPRVAYQVVGGTKNTAMVVVDPASNTDRQGLQQIGDYLCNVEQKCVVWFWDDINKAASVFPVDPAKEQYTIAYYQFDWANWTGELRVYTLGDPR